MRRSSSLVLVAVAFLACLAFVSPALALLETGPASGTSTYNPNIGDSAYWRWDWGNSLDPDVTFTAFPSDSAQELQDLGYAAAVDGRTQTTGFIYEMRQLRSDGAMPAVSLVPGVSPSTGRSISGVFQGNLKTLLVGSFDIRTLVNDYGWHGHTDANYPGGVAQGEGLWGFQYLFRNQFRTENATPARPMFRFGVDLTPPDTVANLRSSSVAPLSTHGWTENRRLNLVWKRPTGLADNYDRLSGVGGYSIGIDGAEVAFVTNTSPDPKYEPYAALLNPTAALLPEQISNATLESLPGGQHTVGVTTVDRATNRSSTGTLLSRVDYDSPQGTMVWTDASRPAWRLGGTATVSVNATDAAGVSSVRFYIDRYDPSRPSFNFFGNGVNKGQGIWSLTGNFSSVGDGGHMLIAVINDMIGQDPIAGSGPYWIVPHSVQVAQPVYVDRTAPKANVSAPSYHRIVTVWVRNVNEASTLTIKIDGQTFASVAAAAGGTYYQSILVPARANGASTRNVPWSVRLTDNVGNTRVYSGSSPVTYWRLDKIGRGKVRLVVY